MCHYQWSRREIFSFLLNHGITSIFSDILLLIFLFFQSLSIEKDINPYVKFLNVKLAFVKLVFQSQFWILIKRKSNTNECEILAVIEFEYKIDVDIVFDINFKKNPIPICRCFIVKRKVDNLENFISIIIGWFRIL